MKIKQTFKILTAFLFLLSTAVSFVSFGPAPETALAYKCQGGDYYDAEKRECWSYKNVTTTTTVTDAQGNERQVKTCNSGETVHHKDADGTCWAAGGEKKDYAPSYDDGTSVESGLQCNPYDVTGVGPVKTNYDASEYTCKVDKSDCLAAAAKKNAANPLVTVGTAQCFTGKVAPSLPEKDPTTNCLTEGGKYEHNGGASKCTYTADTCKAKGKKINKDSNGCEALNECDKKYPNANQKKEFDACNQAMENPNEDCGKKSNDAEKKACETGQAAAPESFDKCGDADTVIIKCAEGEHGVAAIASVLRIFILVLSILIGVAAVGGLAWASILYAKAEDNQSNVTEARTLIRNIVIGILLYGFMVAIINWLVPGGIIG